MDIILRGQDIPADLREFFEPIAVGMKDTIEWRPSGFTGAHFACWPEAIPEKLIRAATSERGCCPHCGAPWVRVVEREVDNTGYANGPGGKKARDPHGNGASANSTLATVARYVTETTGWQPSCTCPAADPIPCLVLDPFSGSGTTAKVAVRLGRRAIGVDISEEYLGEITAQRFGAGVQMELTV